MAAVLTTSMTLRIILSVRGSLVQGGTFTTGSSSHTASSRTTHVISTRSGGATNLSQAQHTYTLDGIRSKREGEGEWSEPSVKDDKGVLSVESTHPEIAQVEDDDDHGVKVTVDRQIGYDVYPRGQ